MRVFVGMINPWGYRLRTDSEREFVPSRVLDQCLKSCAECIVGFDRSPVRSSPSRRTVGVFLTSALVRLWLLCLFTGQYVVQTGQAHQSLASRTRQLNSTLRALIRFADRNSNWSPSDEVGDSLFINRVHGSALLVTICCGVRTLNLHIDGWREVPIS